MVGSSASRAASWAVAAMANAAIRIRNRIKQKISTAGLKLILQSVLAEILQFGFEALAVLAVVGRGKGRSVGLLGFRLAAARGFQIADLFQDSGIVLIGFERFTQFGERCIRIAALGKLIGQSSSRGDVSGF